ncbi:MAG TPA: RIP metalloprotease RseP [Gammaproteobacteria bacterium]|nr:RIP metalloprotease RseP [Gammaproteobacteria bacterium]
MLEFLYSLAGFIIALGILVAVHEFGHFWVARKMGVRVLTFSIGFGKSLWSRTAADGTKYSIGAIPLGGYVKMLDENEAEVAEDELDKAFNRKPLWRKTLVVLAGPGFNFIFAIFAYAAVYAAGVEGLEPVVGRVVENSVAQQSGFQQGDRLLTLDGRKLHTWQDQRLYLFSKALARSSVSYELETVDGMRRVREMDLSRVPMSRIDANLVAGGIGLIGWLPDIPPLIDQVIDGGPAAQGGMRSGDRITMINGESVAQWQDVVKLVSASPAEPVTIEVERNGLREMLTMTPDAVDVSGQSIGRIGISVQPVDFPEDKIVQVDYSLPESFVRGVETTWMMSVLTLRMLYKMATLEVSSKNISGPLTIAQYAGKSAQVGLDSFILFLAIVSVSLGVLNLLPIPVLDGGHLLYYAIEAIKGSPVSEKVMIWGQQVGILLLFLLMSLAVYNDMGRLLN